MGEAWRWRVVSRVADRGRWWLARPLGQLVDRLDRALLRLYWRAQEHTDDDDGIPF